MSNQTITIVSLTGHQDYAQGSSYAIQRSYQELQKKIPAERLRCLLISPERPKDCPDYILHRSCKPFSYFEYNIFMLYSLGQLIDTDFALVVQNDGWVIDGNNWDNDFFNYDFIGAPYPALVKAVNNQFCEYKRDIPYWYANKDNLPTDHYENQNGGFSLRSKRLLNVMRELDLSLEIKAPDLINTEPAELKWTHVGHFEDLFLTGVKRKQLEQAGLNIAPRDVALRFSIEHLGMHTLLHAPLEKNFGCHFSSTFTLVGVNKVRINKRIAHSQQEIVENPLVQILLKNGFQFIVPQSLI
ncbi:hypothetical protein A1D22_08575 [Pasteurellaceae bacterium LFhippo2]|nr:hypothetical protein [Pasteurellaceae bacterium LFhippo2]